MNGFGDFGRALPQHQRGCSCIQCRNEGVKILDHQGFYAAAFEKTVSRENLPEVLTRELEGLAAWVRQSGGIIGHIKAAISSQGQSLTLSITKDTLRSQGSWAESGPAKVSFAAIVARVDRETLKTKAEEICQAIEGGTP